MTAEKSTLTARFAAVQLKMLHLQFRMKKIYDDQGALSEAQHETNRQKIRGYLPAGYTVIDMLVSIEHVSQLMRDMFATPELRSRFTDDDYKILNHTKKIADKWRPVRNRLGGHIDIEVVEDLCSKHGFRGVFLGDDLECDTAILNLLLLESAVNFARKQSDIIGRDLDMKSSLASEVAVLVDLINDDWRAIFDYFKPMMELMYRMGKEEKIAVTDPHDRAGIVRAD